MGGKVATARGRSATPPARRKRPRSDSADCAVCVWSARNAVVSTAVASSAVSRTNLYLAALDFSSESAVVAANFSPPRSSLVAPAPTVPAAKARKLKVPKSAGYADCEAPQSIRTSIPMWNGQKHCRNAVWLPFCHPSQLAVHTGVPQQIILGVFTAALADKYGPARAPMHILEPLGPQFD